MPMNMHELGIIYYDCGHKSMKYGPNFSNFMGGARENLLCFNHEHGHVHAKEPLKNNNNNNKQKQKQKTKQNKKNQEP